MPKPERGLITSILENEDAASYVNRIKSHWLQEEVCIRALEIIRSHFNEYGETISLRLFKQDLPSFPMESYGAGTAVLYDRVKQDYLRSKMLEIEDYSSAISQDDPEAALDYTTGEIAKLKRELHEDDTDRASFASVWENYTERRDNKDKLGIPWKWEPMQRGTHGAKYGGYYVFYGRPKNMKTYICLAQLADWAYYFQRRTLIISREMTADELFERMALLYAGLDSDKFETGTFNEAEENELRDAIHALTELDIVFVETVDGYGAAAAAEIKRLADEYEIGEGDVLFVDGAYFYAEDSNWASLGAFSRGLKQDNIRRKNILLVTNQSNRKQTNTMNSDAASEMHMGEGPIQDCDAAVKVRFDPKELHIHCMMSTVRRGKPGEWTIHAQPCVDFSTKYSDAPDEDEGVESTEKVSRRKKAPSVAGKRALVIKSGKMEVQNAS